MGRTIRRTPLQPLKNGTFENNLIYQRPQFAPIKAVYRRKQPLNHNSYMFFTSFMNTLLVCGTGSTLTNQHPLLCELREPTILLYNLTTIVTPPDTPITLISLFAISRFTQFRLFAILVCACFAAKTNTNTLFEQWALTPRINTGLDNPLAAIHPPLLIFAAVLYSAHFLRPTQTTCYSTQHMHNMSEPNYFLYICLTSLALSCWWANQELFWGSYWNWDPVETSAAWATGTAILLAHSSWKCRRHRQRALSLHWSFCTPPLIFIFNKTILAQSVHSFNQGPISAAGPAFSLVVCTYLIIQLLRYFQIFQKISSKHQSLKFPAWALKLLTALLLANSVYILTAGIENNLLNPQTVAGLWVWGITSTACIYTLNFIENRTANGVATQCLHPAPISHTKALTLLPLLYLWPAAHDTMFAETKWPGSDIIPSAMLTEYRQQCNIIRPSGTAMYRNDPYFNVCAFKNTPHQPSNSVWCSWTAQHFYKPTNYTHYTLLKDALI